MRLPDQPVDIVDLNTQPLPYPAAAFDIVCLTEVIEHVEQYRQLLREVYRVLRPGGLVVISTPNILNLRSRLRFLTFGFWVLFGPLHVKDSRRYSTGGHINPVSYFYLAHALLDAGFAELQWSVDKFQRSALMPFAVLYLPIRLAAWWQLYREKHRHLTISPENLPFVEAMNAPQMLLGRTVIVSAVKEADQKMVPGEGIEPPTKGL